MGGATWYRAMKKNKLYMFKTCDIKCTFGSLIFLKTHKSITQELSYYKIFKIIKKKLKSAFVPFCLLVFNSLSMYLAGLLQFTKTKPN